MAFTIAELIQEQGRQQANARRERGAVVGNLVGQLGQVPGQILGARQQQQDRYAAQAERDRQVARQQAQDARVATQDQREAKVFDQGQQDRNKATAAQEAQRIAASGYQGVPEWIQDATRRGLWTPEEGQQLLTQAQTPDGAKRIVDFIAPLATPKTPEAFTLGEGQKRYGPDGKLLADNPKPEEAPKPVTFGTPVRVTVNGKLTTARPGSDDNWYIGGKKVDGTVDLYDKPTASEGSGQSADVKDAIAGMKNGTLPPLLPGRASKEYVEMLAEARRQNYDLASAATDWVATQKHIAALNSTQQTRLNQSIGALPDLLDSVDSLGKQWKAGRFPLLNRANLAVAKSGVYGKDSAKIANKLEAQIADVVADLGNVYMGGNSPTDHALELASKSLSANWDSDVLHDMVEMAKKNVTIRQNSIHNVGVAGASDGNPYAPKTDSAAVGAVEEWVRGADGKLVRKGK